MACGWYTTIVASSVVIAYGQLGGGTFAVSAAWVTLGIPLLSILTRRVSPTIVETSFCMMPSSQNSSRPPAEARVEPPGIGNRLLAACGAQLVHGVACDVAQTPPDSRAISAGRASRSSLTYRTPRCPRGSGGSPPNR